MRLKGRYVPEKKVKIVEIDCGMGMKELRAEAREIQAITMMPRKPKDPAWKKPVIIASLMASAVAMGMGLTLAGCGLGLLLLVGGMGWMSFVIVANSTERRRRCSNWMATCRHSRRGNARRRNGRTDRSWRGAFFAAKRSKARRTALRATGTSTHRTARYIGTAGQSTAKAC